MKIAKFAIVPLLIISSHFAFGQSTVVTAFATGTYGIQDANNAGTYTYQTGYAANIGEYFAPGGQVDIIQFQLPTIDGGSYTFTSANLYNELYAVVNVVPAHDFDLYALGISATPSISDSMYYSGPSDTGNTLIQQAYLTGSINGGPNGSGNGNPGGGNQDPINSSLAGATALANYLNTVDANNAAAGEYLTLRINYDIVPTTWEGFGLLTAGAGGSNEQPTLTLNYTSIPEPPSYALLGFGGLGVWVFVQRKRARILS